jgi:hypothetical protein
MLDTIDPSREMICGSVDYFHRTDISLPVSINYESRRIHFSGMDVEGEGGAIAVGDEVLTSCCSIACGRRGPKDGWKYPRACLIVALGFTAEANQMRGISNTRLEIRCPMPQSLCPGVPSVPVVEAKLVLGEN